MTSRTSRRLRSAAVAAGSCLLVLTATVAPAAAAARGTATTAAAGSSSPGRPGSVGPVAPLDRKALRAAVEQVAQDPGPGALALVADRGRPVWRGAAGYADLEGEQRMRPDMTFRIGSVTKTFVATVVLQLVGEGRIGLDDTVERWLPGALRDGSDITVKQLLTHHSGLVSHTSVVYSSVEALDAARFEHFSPRRSVAIADAAPRVAEPGTSWQYSNTNYVLLGLIAQRAAHRPLEALIDQRIIRPLRLHDTAFPVDEIGIPGRYTRGYVHEYTETDWEDWTLQNPSILWASGNMTSSAGDLARFLEALLGGRLLSPAMLREMRDAVPVVEGSVVSYGDGLFRVVLPACGKAVWGHGGDVIGYSTYAFRSDEGRVLVAARNSYGPAFSLYNPVAVAAFCPSGQDGTTRSPSASADRAPRSSSVPWPRLFEAPVR